MGEESIKEEEYENLEGLNWDNFFEQIDKQIDEEDDNEKKTNSTTLNEWNQDDDNKVVFSGVATLPHDKAVCYGVCTVSQVPKLVKCEDCSLVVKMVGFGHHRKFRHKETRLLTRQTLKEQAEDSSNSDSNDDCQGFLLSPPHYHLSVPSTSDASSSTTTIFGSGQWRATHPLDSCSTSISNSSTKHLTTTGLNKQQSSPQKVNEPPRLYGVEKWNDLRLVLKRTPEKLASDPNQQQQQHLNQDIQKDEKDVQENVSNKKSKKPSISRAISSKKKRKKKSNKKSKEIDEEDDNCEANEIVDSPPSQGLIYQPVNDAQECDTYTDDAEHDDEDSFLTIPAQIPSSNDDSSFVTIPAQLTPSTTSKIFWDPRESAGRPDVVKGTFKKTQQLISKSNPPPISKNLVNLSSVRQTTSAAGSIGGGGIQRDCNLDKLAGPSILKRGQMSSPQPYQQQQSSYYNTSTEQSSTQNNQFLQNQFSKMQQQMQKRRVLTRDFDAISPSSDINTRKNDDINNPDICHQSHSPSSDDTSSSTCTNIYMDAQEENNNICLNKSLIDSTSHSSSSHFVNNKLSCSTIQSDEFTRSNQFIHHNEGERIQSSSSIQFSKIQNDNTSTAQKQSTNTMFRCLGRNTNNNSGNESKQMIIKNNIKTTQWKGTDSNSPLATPQPQQQRKISSTTSLYSSPKNNYITTPSGTRFIPVDPRGLISMQQQQQKNSSSNSITSSKSNSPIAPNIQSTPSPASYINSPSRCDIINNINVEMRSSQRDNYDVDYDQQQQQFMSSSKMNIMSSSPSIKHQRQQNQFSLNQNNYFRNKRLAVDEIISPPQLTSTPNNNNRYKTSINTKRFKSVLPNKNDQQQQQYDNTVPIHQSPRIRPIFPQKQHSNLSISPIPGPSNSINDVQYQMNYQMRHLNPPSSSSTSHFRHSFNQQQRHQHHHNQHYHHHPRHNNYYNNNNKQIRNRGGGGISNYFPKPLSSSSNEYSEQQQHPQQSNYSQRFYYEKSQQQSRSFINSPPPLVGGGGGGDDTLYNNNDYNIIGSPPPSSSGRLSSTGGNLYEQNIPDQNTQQQQQPQQPSSYSYNITSINNINTSSTSLTTRRLPLLQQQQQSSSGYLQQNYISNNNRFISPHNNNISSFLQSTNNIIDYNNIQQTQQTTTNFIPQYNRQQRIDDSHVLDPPPILEAEGRLPSLETLAVIPIYSSNSNNRNNDGNTNISKNTEETNNDDDPGTRSSSASDLDLREIINNNVNNNIPPSSSS